MQADIAASTVFGSNENDLAEMLATSLDATGRYRVLRRLNSRASYVNNENAAIRHGLFVDVETTGLDPEKDEVIELAMVQFDYTLDGRIVRIGKIFEALRQPTVQLPSGISALTGITHEMLAGRSIDMPTVQVFVTEADLIIAHNAAFDRRFLERMDPVFVDKPWACSMSQIDWMSEGFEGTKLAYLAMGAGFFYDRHRAANDCLAAVELLSLTLPISGDLAMKRLLDKARKDAWRISAIKAPFDRKEELKRRGYRWNANPRGGPVAWYKDVDEDLREEEIAYLRNVIGLYEADIPSRKMTAWSRFSDLS